MKKANNTPPEQENPRMPLTRRNYILLAVGFAVILLGFVLMAGGGSDSPDEFNYAMFSWRRITLAPILVIGGFVIEIYAIMNELKSRGIGVLFVSSEMPEVMGMSDRILVMCNGRITGNLISKQTTQDEILRCATQYTVQAEQSDTDK